MANNSSAVCGDCGAADEKSYTKGIPPEMVIKITGESFYNVWDRSEERNGWERVEKEVLYNNEGNCYTPIKSH